eukprot:TRINITY_DN1328_c0_g1_i2.p1 TRINITY_DN1328_c0_g1~~TRINITY_DN1328_c0_g1_i2.p1  ORF type:complete len:257 (+),score=65.95 TRINITY_DN1328_c0_g1_i2:141-911(+)
MSLCRCVLLCSIAFSCRLRLAAAGWIDPDTPDSAYSTASLTTGDEYLLVMSDEFEKDGRAFEDGMDPRWGALHKNDYTNAALQFYAKDAVTTTDGFLKVTTTNEDVTFKYWDDDSRGYKHMTKNYKSGMVMGWNKFCFKGGVVEVSAALPGQAYIGGLWPAIWLLGNLARATYTGSSDYTWPWSYNECNRTSAQTAQYQIQQEINACDALKHYGMEPFRGRGSPEIDLLEAMPGRDPYSPYVVGKPYVSTSYQVPV